MINHFQNTLFLCLLALAPARPPALHSSPPGSFNPEPAATASDEKHLLYVAAPGIRDDLQFGGAGILVFDINHDHRFLKRIPTPASEIAHPENIKGICASA